MKLTEIIKIKGDWQEVVDASRTTVGKESLGREPSRKWKREMVISEHSTIRCISIKWIWRNIKSWVATHWSRHKWECYIQTQRTDRTGINRDNLPQSQPVDFEGEANPQNLIDTHRKRLCKKASEETRLLAEDFKIELYNYEPEISDGLVPNCIYRFGCPEHEPCNVWRDFRKYCVEKDVVVGNLTIQQRYDLYNEWFYKTRGIKHGKQS